MAGTNLSFSKVVATPTPNAWSQAYSAGSLFAAISLHKETPTINESSLSALGKDLISTLESEFFTLEIKDLESIKKAIDATFSKVNENTGLTFVVCFLNENILYLYASGGGKALLKRGEKIGTVIDSEDNRDIKTASGYIQDNDYIILQTKPFIQLIPSSTIASALDKEKVEDIAEEIAPHVHEKEEGGASAIVLSYKENSSGIEPIKEAGVSEDLGQAAAASATIGAAVATQTETPNENAEETIEESTPDKAQDNDESINDEIEKMEQSLNESSIPPKPDTLAKEESINTSSNPPIEETSEVESFATDQRRSRRVPGMGLAMLKRLSSRRTLIIIGVIIIILVIFISIFMFMNRGGSSGNDFNAIFSVAKERYEEGLSLKELNESLAQENFTEAQAILTQNKDVFPEGSDEDNQIEELLSLVNKELSGSTTGGDTTTATEVNNSESKILALAIENDTKYLTQNEDFILFLTDKGVIRVDKGNDEEETVIESSWTDAGGIGVFGSNIYVLDKDDNIFKFVPTEEDYSKTDYLTSDVPSFTKSVSMTIDGSIYVLDSDGTISKFTRGASDDFTTSGLSKPLSNPTQIWANEDSDNIYILDNGNSRIVVLGTNGEFIKAYTADIIKNATAFDVQEGEDQIYILSDAKIYKISLQ